MASKPTDSQELKLGPGWTSLSKSTIHSSTPAISTASVTSAAVPSSAARIAYTKAQLLELYEPGSTATIPPEMTKYPGLTSSEPLVPVNIAPDDHIAHVSALVESTEPTTSSRSRFQTNPPRAGVEAILGRDHAPTSATHSSSSLPPTDAPSASPPPKKSGHVNASSRDFWNGSAVLAPAERPSTSGGTALERRPLPLKPRSTAPDRASSPNANPTDKSSSQQPYWTRSGRTAADANSNWRGGNTSVTSGGTRYPGSSNDDIPPTSSGGAAERVAQARKSSDFSGTSTSTRSGFSRDGGLFSRNNKDALKPTNTRDLSALTKGSNRDPSSSSSSLHQDREARVFKPENSHRSQYDIMTDQRKLWFYKDPQNVSQGPFTASQIMEWHKLGYYSEELPVSKHREHGFKALDIAFGLRKEEIPLPAPPPGFVKDASSTKKEPTGTSTTSSSRPARDDRGRRGGRTVEELAEEVEMMRLQNHKKSQESNVNSTSEMNEPRKEKSFFDSETPKDKELNGHGILNEPLEKPATKPIEKPKEDVTASTVNFVERNETSVEDPVVLPKTSISMTLPPKATVLPPKTSERMGPESPPPKQSRLAAFMGQGLADDDEKQTKLPVVSSPFNDTSTGRTLPEISSAIMSETVQTSTNVRPPIQPLATASIETTRLNDSGLSSPWKNIMMGVQQQHIEPARTPAGGQTTTEQDLMAIDPAIAHASFARPSPPVSSDVSSPHIASNSQELPAWLRFSAAPETAPIGHRHEQIHDVNHALSAHLPVHTPIVQHSGPQELGVLQDSSMHVQTQPDYQAIERARHAQAQVQAQQMRKLQLQQQIQAQVAAAQRSSAVARAQAQAQAQANAQLHAPGQDRGWVLQHQLSQYQHRFELECRAHMESTRTVQAARTAAANVGVADPDHQRYLTVAAQAEAVSKQHALAMENIKAAAGRTHSQLLRLAQEQQQQRDFQAQAPQVHSDAFITGTLSSTHAGLPSSNQPIVSTQMQPNASSSVFEVKRTETAHPMDEHSSVISGDQGDPNHIIQRSLPEAYEAIVQSDTQGWEQVNRKSEPNGAGSSLLRNPPSNIQDVRLAEDVNLADQLERNGTAVSVSSQLPSNQVKPEVVDAPKATAVESMDHHHAQNDAPKQERISETVSAIAPWSKASAQGSANGLSLREIQRQEELRSKANEKVTIPPQEKEQVRVAPARWNTLQPWGGAGDPAKQRTMSLREQMRYEEEQRKKSASLAQDSTPSTNGVALGTRTGWASLVANSKPPSTRQTTTVVGRKMEDETSFWDSVNSGSHSSSAPTRRVQKPNLTPQPQVPAQQVHSNAPTTRQTSSQNNVTSVRRPPSPAKTAKSERRDVNNEVVIGGRISHEFAKWCTDNLQELTGNPNQDTTLVEYLVTIKSPSEIRDTVVQSLGATDKARSFADEFIRRLEFEKPSMVAEAGNGGSTGRKKGRRQRAARVDPSLVLGFTSTSSSSRIMQGTIETPEMK